MTAGSACLNGGNLNLMNTSGSSAASQVSHASHASNDLCNRQEIADVILAWAYSRDQGRWDEMADTFTADGRIAVTWFTGSHTEFIEASRARFGQNFSKHLMCGTHVQLFGERAFAETSIMIISRARVHDIDAVGTSHARFLDILKIEQGRWKIHRRSAVYDADHLMAEMPGDVIPFERDRLEQFPRAYRFLAYRLALAGLPIGLDLPVAASPAGQGLRQACLDWCRMVADD